MRGVESVLCVMPTPGSWLLVSVCGGHWRMMWIDCWWLLLCPFCLLVVVVVVVVGETLCVVCEDVKTNTQQGCHGLIV